MSTSFADLQSQLGQLSLRDANRLGRRLEGARRIRKPEARQSVLDEIAARGLRGGLIQTTSHRRPYDRFVFLRPRGNHEVWRPDPSGR